jgi:PPOX class probable F420-dependent enzyme
VARFATCDERGQPHLVPVTFAVLGDIIVIAIDHKPKRSMNLKRLRNIADNPRVSLLVDRYDDDWSQLWWVRADGVAAVLEEDTERAAPLDWLAAKYEHYRQRRPAGPVIRIDAQRWRGWAYGAE